MEISKHKKWLKIYLKQLIQIVQIQYNIVNF
jgi:hypothetical protein